MANGTSRIILADNQLKKEAQASLNAKFKDESNIAKGIKKFPLKNPSEHNHSK